MPTSALHRGWQPPCHSIDCNPNDPVETMIVGAGYIDSPHLWRRWISTQIFRSSQDGTSGFEARFFQSKPYTYEWSTAYEEISAMSHMHGQDLRTRARFFNADTILAMAQHYDASFRTYIATLQHTVSNGHDCIILPDGRPLRTDMDAFPGLNDTLAETALAVRRLKDKKCRQSFRELKNIITRFQKHAVLNVPIEKSDAWKNAFYGTGAFYAMDSMIKFQNCRIMDENKNFLSLEASLRALDALSENYSKEQNKNHQFFLAMLDFAAYNGINCSADTAITTTDDPVYPNNPR